MNGKLWISFGIWQNTKSMKLIKKAKPVTGSAVPEAKADQHAGGARFLRLRQYSMTGAEKNQELNSPPVSLKRLFDGEETLQVSFAAKELNLDEIGKRIVTPGFPRLVNDPEEIALKQRRSYLADAK